MPTFLFTDIQGSTRLWEQYPEGMAESLVRHDRLLRGAITQHGGRVFKTIGDAFCAVFPEPLPALAAALEAQRALGAEAWLLPDALRVRMAVHTGAAESRDGDYFGPALNRVARLLGAAHGGQVLVSQAACEAAGGTLPDGATLLDLGAHRLKDLAHSQSIYRLRHPRLPDVDAPLRSLEAFSHNLPVQLTSFVGREREIAEVRRLLASSRILTLTGAGGIGKTRLALQAAADLLEDYPDGVWLVELAAVSDSDRVAQTAAGVLGVREEPGQPLAETVAAHLRARRLLLLLDNCEHLLSACSAFAEQLLRSAPAVQLVITSREQLGLPGETIFRVPSLSLPEDCSSVTHVAWPESEAVRLFVERARLQQPAFDVGAANLPAIADICRRLDGIPLAVELAAARTRALTVEQLAQRLDDRFRLLTGGSRTALPRQQTLRATIDWSYELLRPSERCLLQRLSVFSGGWSLEAAECVCGFDPVEQWEVLDLLTSLVDKSLVLYEERTGAGRYHLLETVRQYAQDRQVESGGALTVRDRHLAHFLELAEEAAIGVTGAEQRRWLDQLGAELDNCRAALDWAAGREGSGAAQLRLAEALSRFWEVRGLLGEGRSHLDRALTRATSPSLTRAKAMNSTGWLACLQGDLEEAESTLRASLALYEELGAPEGVALCLNTLGNVAYTRGDLPQARSAYEQSLQIRRAQGDRRGVSTSLMNLANIASDQAEYAQARSMLEEAAAIRRELGDNLVVANLLNNLGNIAYHQRDWGQAAELHEQALAIRREMGDRFGVAMSLQNLGNIASDQEEFVTADRLFRESLEMKLEMGDRRGVAQCLVSLGNLASRRRDEGLATQYFEEGVELARSVGMQLELAQLLHGLGRVRIQTGELPDAARLLEESLALGYRLRALEEIAAALIVVAELCHAASRPRPALVLISATEALRNAVGAPLTGHECESLDGLLLALSGSLPGETEPGARAEGQAMNLDNAVSYALDLLGESTWTRCRVV